MAYKLVKNIVSRFLTTFTARLSPETATNASSSFAVQYLTASCGLSIQSALSVSQKLRLKEKHLWKQESVLKLLKSNGFNNTQITKLIQKWPRILHCQVEGNLKPKFDFFLRHGFAGNLLSEILLSQPMILQRALDSHIQPSFVCLKWVLGRNEKVVEAVSRTPLLLLLNLKNLEFLLKEGVSLERIEKYLLLNLRSVMLKHDWIVFATNVLKDIGLRPKNPMFIHGLRVLSFMNPSIWKEKLEMMKRMGWSEEKIFSAFSRFPYFMFGSERKLSRAMDFYMNTMKVDRERILNNPVWLNLSIDKRVRPRLNVFRVLQSNRLIMEENKKIGVLIQMSERSSWRDMFPSLRTESLAYYKLTKNGKIFDSWRRLHKVQPLLDPLAYYKLTKKGKIFDSWRHLHKVQPLLDPFGKLLLTLLFSCSALNYINTKQ